MQADSKPFDLLSAMPPLFELRGGVKSAVLAVYGVIAVTELDTESVTLTTHSGRLRICGKDLSLNTFENRSVELCGRVLCVELINGN